MLLPSTALAFDCFEATCPKMKTCAEAHYKFKVCGHSKRDADYDGIPCEDLCGKDMATYQERLKAQTGESVDVATDKAPPGTALGFVSSAEAAEGDDSGDGKAFTCAGKRTCGQMLTCAEAKFYLASCRVKSLDRDGDGVPCNSLCR